MSDSDIVITRGKKRLHQGDEENPNTETSIKELKKYFDTKPDPIKDQFTEENEKLVKRIKIVSQPKLRYRMIRYNMDLIIPQQLN